MANDRYGIYVARIGDILLRQLDSVTITSGQTKTEKIPGGAVDRGAIITAFADPVIRCKTSDLDAILGTEVDIDIQTGYRVDTVNATTTAATLIQYQHRAEGGVFSASAASHFQVTSNKGFAVIDEIRADQDSVEGAVADIAYHALSDSGNTAPLSIAQTGGGGMTSTPTYGSLFYMGPVMFGTVGSGVSLEGCTSIRIRPGLEVRVKRSEGAAYARAAMIHSRKPEISMRVENVNEFYSRLATFFGAGVPSNTCFYLQRGLANGVRTPMATATHVRFVATTGEWSPDTLEVAGEDDTGVEIIFRPLTLTYAYGVAIA